MITGSKTTQYTNDVEFQLQIVSPPEEISLQKNNEKTKSKIFSKYLEKDNGHFKKSREFLLIYCQTSLAVSATTI